MEVKDRYRRFGEWKQQPHQVAPLSEEEHECATCGTRFEGNYCPRCGQSAKIGRYSFKKALLLFLDVWGVGNRGMFRSIRDLILRPGYMIRDYLRGMQMAYFPPFKMFFLLIALSLVVDSGLNIQGINRSKQNEAEEQEIVAGWFNNSEEKQTEKQAKEASTQNTDITDRTEGEKTGDLVSGKLDKLLKQHTSAFILGSLLLFSLPLYLLFRHSPAIPDLRLSECFVAMVYITNMIIIFEIIPSLLCFSVKAEMIYDILVIPLVAIVPIKQLSGYSYPSTIWRVMVAFIPFAILFVLVFIAIGVGMAIYYRV